jgi:hypothetical protein
MVVVQRLSVGGGGGGGLVCVVAWGSTVMSGVGDSRQSGTRAGVVVRPSTYTHVAFASTK